MKITEPGIYRGVLDADYRADPCPSPSLTQSAVKTLIERSPLHAWTGNPRLNPNFEPNDDTKFDIGNVAHRLILGRGKEIEVVDFADWRKKEAQAAREAAADAGKIAVLYHQFEQANDMVRTGLAQLDNHEDKDAFTEGAAEVMIAWEEYGIWFRSLIDCLSDDLRTGTTIRHSGMSVAPHLIGQRRGCRMERAGSVHERADSFRKRWASSLSFYRPRDRQAVRAHRDAHGRALDDDGPEEGRGWRHALASRDHDEQMARISEPINRS